VCGTTQGIAGTEA